MNYFSRVRVIRLVVVLLVNMLLMNVMSYADDGSQSTFEQYVSKKFIDNKLEDVLRSLSKETGVLIFYDEQISQKKVSGNFKKVPLATVVNRLLSGVNHSLEMDVKANTLFIKAFGKVKYVSTGTGAGGAAGFLPSEDMSYAELRTLLDKQAQDFAKQLEDGKEYLEEFGMTRMEAKKQLNKQLEQFELEDQDPSHFDQEVNMTVGQWQEMQEKQQASFEKELSDDSSLADDGVSMGEHRSRLKAQASDFAKQLENESEIIPELGITRGEHRLLLARQLKKYNQSLTE